MRKTFNKEFLTSICCTAVFALILSACGGGKAPLKGMMPNIFMHHQAVLVSAGRSGAHLVSTSTQPIAAAFLQTSTPLAQSFDAFCSSYNVSSVPAGDVVPVPGLSALACDSFNSDPDTSFGKIIHDSANLSDLVVDIYVNSGTTAFSCEDKTDSIAVTDGQKVRAFFDPATNKVFVGANNVATALSCTVPVPAGSQIQSIEAQWVKN